MYLSNTDCVLEIAVRGIDDMILHDDTKEKLRKVCRSLSKLTSAYSPSHITYVYQ